MGANARARQLAAKRKQRRQLAAVISTVVVALLAGVVVLTLRGGDTQRAAASGSGAEQFPDFSLTAVDGNQVTRASLAGRKALIWFTDSACVPCQLGAVKVRQLEETIKPADLAVVAVFVTDEPDSSMLGWRDKYARPDWAVALDRQNSLSNKVGLRYLDTKYLLDENGKIIDVNSKQVDDSYLAKLQKELTA